MLICITRARFSVTSGGFGIVLIGIVLIYMSYDVEYPMEGCTPLHWASIRGNLEACTVLVHASTKQELMVKDNAGFTPVQLASDKGHRHVALFLVRNFVLVLPLFLCSSKKEC